MVLLAHIIIALTSILATAYTFISPSKAKFYFSCSFVALTIGSGTYLIFTKPAHMVQTCFEGLIYIAIVSTALVLARNKLARQQT